MRVAVTVIVDIDKEKYQDEYHEVVTTAEVREYVKYDVLEAARNFYAPFYGGYINDIKLKEDK